MGVARNIIRLAGWGLAILAMAAASYGAGASTVSTPSIPSILSNKSSAPAPVTLQATVDRTQMVIGDSLKYQLRVEWAKGVETPLVRPGLKLGEFDIVDATHGDVETLPDGRKTQTHVFELSTFDTGDYTIPPFTVDYRSDDGATMGTVQTPEVKVTVKSVAAAESGTDIRDLKPPAVIAPDNTVRNALIAAGATFVILLAFLVWFLRRRARLARERRIAPPEPPRPPHEAAIAALDELAANLPATREEAMAFYVRLSEIIRVFLGRRFEFDAMDRTTTEIVTALGGTAALSALAAGDGALQHIEDFLLGCDLVKFAKFPADRDQAVAAVGEAREIVDASREKDTSEASSEEANG